jgi:hypothetical protein
MGMGMGCDENDDGTDDAMTSLSSSPVAIAVDDESRIPPNEDSPPPQTESS